MDFCTDKLMNILGELGRARSLYSFWMMYVLVLYFSCRHRAILRMNLNFFFFYDRCEVNDLDCSYREVLNKLGT